MTGLLIIAVLGCVCSGVMGHISGYEAGLRDKDSKRATRTGRQEP
jgi:hypothetical protein